MIETGSIAHLLDDESEDSEAYAQAIAGTKPEVIEIEEEEESSMAEDMLNFKDKTSQMDEKVLQAEMARSPFYPPGVFATTQDVEDYEKVFNDGKRIFVNRLIFYPKSCYKPNMISFSQLLLKDLGLMQSKFPDMK